MSVEANPEFTPGVLSSVGLAIILTILAAYAAWAAGSLGPDASFHITNGISGSVIGLCGIGISAVSAVLAWKGFGLNAIGALLVSTSLGSVLGGNSSSYGLATVTVLAVSLLMLSIHFTRRYFEYNPLRTFVALWGLTFASSVAQLVFYRVLFEPTYPLLGVLLLKVLVFGLGGLTLLFASPRENEEYEI